MVIFHSYVSSPEGIILLCNKKPLVLNHEQTACLETKSGPTSEIDDSKPWRCFFSDQSPCRGDPCAPGRDEKIPVIIGTPTKFRLSLFYKHETKRNETNVKAK